MYGGPLKHWTRKLKKNVKKYPQMKIKIPTNENVSRIE
jgi:hypothetical protein